MSAPPETIKTISVAMGHSWDASNGPMLDDRHWHRTLFKTCGVDILWFGTARELFYALGSAVVGHQNAYEKREICMGMSAMATR
ncbi:hypothetical protein AZE42_02746 [Rhizopogon vesiculosus]|uniref:Uncharacterized protein n=1 Tax=Rhizopogon vesiculosus TaxID=180088 RepID=A0A1J8QEQ0_9AGAM|nr:hypothetical protein AZE42_02746 [Rhizopogon vesiculosus]